MIERMKYKIDRLKNHKTMFLVLFSFLLGCTLTINLTQIEKACPLETATKQNPETLKLVVFILSAPKNLDRRNTIRQTWLQLDRGLHKFKMKHYFSVGVLGLSRDDIFHLSGEQSQWGDLILLPLYDRYQNLTLKVSMGLEWLHQRVNFDYLLKCDDDSFVRLDKLWSEFESLEAKFLTNPKKEFISKNLSPLFSVNLQINELVDNKVDLYWGYFNGNADIKRKGKWKEPDWVACDKYLPYALGGGYVLSRNLVDFIAKNWKYLRRFNSEDVTIGFWLAPLNNILRVHDVRFDTEWVTRGCQNFYLVTHNMSIEDMKKMYSQILQNGHLCSVQSVIRSHYLYNWTLTPSQCCSFKQNIH